MKRTVRLDVSVDVESDGESYELTARQTAEVIARAISTVSYVESKALYGANHLKVGSYEVKVAPERMDLQPVSSSNLSAVGYMSSAQLLEVQFKTGGRYRYFNVPANVYEEFLAADSVGQYFHRSIKNRFTYEEVDFNPDDLGCVTSY